METLLNVQTPFKIQEPKNLYYNPQIYLRIIWSHNSSLKMHWFIQKTGFKVCCEADNASKCGNSYATRPTTDISTK